MAESIKGYNDPHERVFEPRADAPYLAFRQTAKRLGREGRIYSVQLADHFDPIPWAFDDLPLINGKLIGEEEI